jgi:hypothetical protein
MKCDNKLQEFEPERFQGTYWAVGKRRKRCLIWAEVAEWVEAFHQNLNLRIIYVAREHLQLRRSLQLGCDNLRHFNLSHNYFDFDEGELVASWQLWLTGLQHLDLRNN